MSPHSDTFLLDAKMMNDFICMMFSQPREVGKEMREYKFYAKSGVIPIFLTQLCLHLNVFDYFYNKVSEKNLYYHQHFVCLS